MFIMMESFSGEFTGVLGKDQGITPEFDKLATQTDVVPTVVGLLGKPLVHQCRGRNLLSLAAFIQSAMQSLRDNRTGDPKEWMQ